MTSKPERSATDFIRTLKDDPYEVNGVVHKVSSDDPALVVVLSSAFIESFNGKSRGEYPP